MSTKISYDFIIIGAGSAGAVLAYYLSQKNYSILIIERGKSQEKYPETYHSKNWGNVFVSNAIHELCTMPQRALANNKTLLVEGNIAGGGSSINSMMYARGSVHDYANWNADPEWSFARITELFNDIEQQLKPEYLNATDFTDAFITAATEVGFIKNNNMEQHGYFGVGHNKTSVFNGLRNSSYTAFLKPALATNKITLLTEATASRIFFENKTAVAVEYFQKKHRYQINLNKGGEVILCAGALESPKLLMLSGIGPAEQLKKFSIPVIIENSEVGKNLIDQPDCPVSYIAKSNLPENINQISVCAFAKSSGVEKQNDLQILLMPGAFNPEMLIMGLRGFPNWILNYRWSRKIIRSVLKFLFLIFPALKNFLRRGYTIMPCLMQPKSRGKLSLKSCNINDDVLVDPNYLADPTDKQALLNGIELARKIGSATALSNWRKKELTPGKMPLEKYINKFTGTTYHYAGTCALDKVVDAQLRIKGLQNIRVADASIMPSLPIVTPNAACMMIGRNAAKIILDGL